MGGQAAGRAGDLAYAFRSDVPRALPDFNRQPTSYPPLTAGLSPGDPWTPMLRAYTRDRIRVRLLAGGGIVRELKTTKTVPAPESKAPAK